MYHPTRGGVRGGRDQFKWDDVKVDKDRENYLGHSLKAPVGRWQKGKDLFWYTRNKNAQGADQDALKAEIQRVKEEEEQSMREALGLAPKRSNRPQQGNRLDKNELSELVKRGSTAEDVGAGHAEAARVDGLGFSRAPRPWETSSCVDPGTKEASARPVAKEASVETADRINQKGSAEEKEEIREKKKRKHHEEKKHEERKYKRHDKHNSRDSDDKRERRKDKKEKTRRNADFD